LEIPSVHELVLQTLKQFELEPSDPISADTQSQHKSVLPDEWSPSIPSVMHVTALDAFRLIITRVPFILLGRAGSGKSHLIRQLLVSSHRAYRLIPLHRELSAKDLLQRRITLRNGDTAWQDSELIKAALSGETAVLDGAEQMRPDVLPSLQSLFVCGKLFLPDGTELCSSGQSSRRISPQFQMYTPFRYYLM
jgi:hypothetical protein